MSIDSVFISGSSITRDGLAEMLEYYIGPHEYVYSYVPLQDALFIIEIARRAEDKPTWFPHGKWATIQSIQENIQKCLAELFREHNK